MSELIGADTRRVDAIADGLDGYAEDVQDLRTLAQRAVGEMRGAWGGGDFEHIAQRWDHEAGPRLGEAASLLSAMVVALRSQSAEQRRVSGGSGSGQDRGSRGEPGLGGGVTSPGSEPVKDVLGDHEASLVSVAGGNDSVRYEASLGKVEATADSSVDVDADGNLVASAGASAAAYLGYAAGGVQAGSGSARAGANARAFVGAVAGADASGSIGPGGARGHLGAEAFVGAKAVVEASGTLAGATAAAGAEISYGIGAHADVDAELSPTGVGVSLDVGAALGLGVGVKLDVSVNPQEVIEAVAGIDHLLAPEPD